MSTLLILTGVVHGYGMFQTPAAFDDEGTYVAQAWAVINRGDLSHYTYWYDHPPGGWLQMAAYFWLTDAFDRHSLSIHAGREFMLVTHLASVVLLYILCRRLRLTRAFCTLAVLAFSLSPLAINYQRMVFLDNLAVLWILAAFVCALTPGRRLAAAAGSGAACFMSVLSKETAAILVPVVFWSLWQNADRRNRRESVFFFAFVFGLLSLLYPVYAAIKNELIPGEGHVSLLGSLHWQLVGRAGSGSVLDEDSGARGLVLSWLHHDPWLLGLGLGLLPVAVALRPMRPMAAALLIQLLLILRSGYLPVPYVVALLPFAATLVAAGAQTAWQATLRVPGPRVIKYIPRTALLVAGATLLLLVTPGWARGQYDHLTSRDVHINAALAWIDEEVPDNHRLLVDDTVWVDLAERGFEPEELEVIWSFKADLDPAIRRQLKNGWRDLDYLVLKDIGDLSTLPIQRAALENSTVVAKFGEGPDTITIRRVNNGQVRS